MGLLPRFGEISYLEVTENLESSTLETSDGAEIAEHPEAIDTAKWAEAQDSPAEGKTSDTVTSTSDDLDGTCSAYSTPINWLIKAFPVEEPAVKAAQQLIEGYSRS